ncbi:hypothetical protein [Rhizobium leguminosarum]|uniref:hypothetical protein n=1 Tax=Rhizobium leguminosarum TaxID=384 RepID=UPI003F960474
MRYVAAFLCTIFLAHDVTAQEAASPGKVAPQAAAAPVGTAIIPTLSLNATNLTDDNLDGQYPMLPQTLAAKNATDKGAATEEPSSRVSGYILNRQLVEQTARAYPPSGVELGQGWNSFLNRPSANICIEGTVEKLPGTNLSASLSTVEDRSSYFDSISASVGGSYGPFSGSGSYLKERQFSNYDANVVMNAVVDTGGRFIKPSKDSGIRLTEDALRLLKMKDGVDRFLQACGDSLVTAIREGGRMSAILSISKVNQAGKEDIQAQAAGGFGGFGANASFRKTVQSASEANNLKLSFEQVGSVFSGVPVTLDELVAKFTQYKVDEQFGPRPYVFFTQNYRSLPNWPDGLENRVSPVDQEFFVLSYYNFTDLGSDYEKAIKNPSSFRNFLKGGPPEISANRDIALTHARNLDLAIWQCVNSFDCSIQKLEKLDRDFQAARKPENQPPSASVGSREAEIEYAQGAFSGFVAVAREAVADPAVPVPVPPVSAGAETSEDMVVLPRMTVSYYRLLAALPLYSIGKDTGFSVPLRDGAPPPDEEILRNFRSWLIAARLRPVAEGYCRRSASHPLCLSGKELRYIVDLLDIAAEPLRPEPAPVVVPPPPPAKPPEVKPAPKPPREPIGRGPCSRNPSICT